MVHLSPRENKNMKSEIEDLKPTIQSLPNDLIAQILHNLSFLDWTISSLVNHRFRNCTNLAYQRNTYFSSGKLQI
jgi:hypothetical protein